MEASRAELQTANCYKELKLGDLRASPSKKLFIPRHKIVVLILYKNDSLVATALLQAGLARPHKVVLNKLHHQHSTEYQH